MLLLWQADDRRTPPGNGTVVCLALFRFSCCRGKPSFSVRGCRLLWLSHPQGDACAFMHVVCPCVCEYKYPGWGYNWVLVPCVWEKPVGGREKLRLAPVFHRHRGLLVFVSLMSVLFTGHHGAIQPNKRIDVYRSSASAGHGGIPVDP